MSWTEEQYADYMRNLRSAVAAPLVKAKPKAPQPRTGYRSKMNKWEEAYDAELRVKWAAGIVQWYGYEAIKLRLAGNTSYTPDFAVVQNGQLEFFEVKGFWRPQARVKFKVAAELFPFFPFTAIRKQKVGDGGGWDVIERFNAKP